MYASLVSRLHSTVNQGDFWPKVHSKNLKKRMTTQNRQKSNTKNKIIAKWSREGGQTCNWSIACSARNERKSKSLVSIKKKLFPHCLVLVGCKDNRPPMFKLLQDSTKSWKENCCKTITMTYNKVTGVFITTLLHYFVLRVCTNRDKTKCSETVTERPVGMNACIVKGTLHLL